VALRTHSSFARRFLAWERPRHLSSPSSACWCSGPRGLRRYVPERVAVSLHACASMPCARPVWTTVVSDCQELGADASCFPAHHPRTAASVAGFQVGVGPRGSARATRVQGSTGLTD
jgi:hypothetical protein